MLIKYVQAFFLHEHPRGSRSWRSSPVQHFLRRADVHVVRCDQCAFGAKNTVGPHWSDGEGENAAILKPTRFMSNSVAMLKRLHGLCPRDHKHQPLLGGRASSASFYPIPLLRAILQGMNDAEHSENAVSSLTESEYDVSRSMSLCSSTTALEPNGERRSLSQTESRRWSARSRRKAEGQPR